MALIVRLSSNLDLKSSSSGNKEIRNFKLNGLLCRVTDAGTGVISVEKKVPFYTSDFISV